MAEDTHEEQPDKDLLEFATEVRQIGAEIVAAVEQGRFEQVKALANYLSMAAALIEQARQEVVEVDPYDLARLKVFRDDETSEPGD